jgi:Na+-transporting methylmalonyl-CoA/oxaloacetate decarboxylase, beta subunit
MSLETRSTLILIAKAIAALLMLFAVIATLLEYAMPFRNPQPSSGRDAEAFSFDSDSENGRESENDRESEAAGANWRVKETRVIGVIGREDGPTSIYLTTRFTPLGTTVAWMQLIGWVLIPFALFFWFKSPWIRGAGIAVGAILLALPCRLFVAELWPDIFTKKKNRDYVVLSEAESIARRLKFLNEITSLELSEQSARLENQTGRTDGDATFMRITLHASDVERVKSALESPRMSETKPDKTFSAAPPEWWPTENAIASAASSVSLEGIEPLNIALAQSGGEAVLCIALPSTLIKFYHPAGE